MRNRELLLANLGRGAPLGNNTKSSTPPRAGNSKRSEGYEIQGVARLLYGREGHRAGLKYPFDYHRTAKCRHVKISDPQVLKSPQHNSAFYTGLAVCGSVWTCPVCAAKIQERRREEIAKAIDKAYLSDMKAVMVTLTFSHLSHDKLKDLLKSQADALKKLRAGNPWKRVKDSVSFKGLIRSLELTYGDNGWHPHTHELWFVDKNADVKSLRKKIVKRWISACSRAGLLDVEDTKKLKAFIRHAVDVKDNAKCSDYLAKMDDSNHWGADAEIAKQSTKKGRKSGLHPFQFLVEYKSGCEKSGKRWIEYSDQMKGKRQIFWSQGLKDWAEVDELTDEELAERYDQRSDFVDEFTAEEWSTILKNEARAIILDLAEKNGREAIRDWLSCHTNEPPD